MADPNQFLQVHGRSVKIHLDPSISMAGDNPANMMPWPGDSKIMIDRFDARANLDFIPEYNSKTDKVELSEKENKELRQQNYERYKILIQNEFLSVPEEKFLYTIELEEKYGGKTYQQKKAKEDKLRAGTNKAAIGFKYEDSTGDAEFDSKPQNDDSDMESDDDFDLNFDVTSLDSAQVHEINKVGHHYGLERKDVFKYFTKDFEEQEEIKANKARDAEKSSGKKSKRRRNRENREYEGRLVSPSFAVKEEESKSRSRSRSGSSDSASDDQVKEEKIEFITSFGGESDQEKKVDSSTERKRSKKKSRKRSKSRDRRRSRSGSRERNRRRKRSRSRSRSLEDWVRRRHRRRSRSRSDSRPTTKRSSRSISRERNRIEKRLTKAFTPPPKPAAKLNLTKSDDSSSSDSSEDQNNGGSR